MRWTCLGVSMSEASCDDPPFAWVLLSGVILIFDSFILSLKPSPSTGPEDELNKHIL